MKVAMGSLRGLLDLQTRYGEDGGICKSGVLG